MKNEKKYHGVVVPMVTPITKEGEIDTEAVKRIVDNFARHQVSPLIMGTTGEGNSVSTRQGAMMIAAAKEAAAGRGGDHRSVRTGGAGGRKEDCVLPDGASGAG